MSALDAPEWNTTGDPPAASAREGLELDCLDEALQQTPGKTWIEARSARVKQLASRAVLQEQLRESQERVKGLFEDAPVACHEIDRRGVILRVNQAECTLLGFEPGEMVGRHIWEFMALGEREKSQEGVRQRLAGELSTVPFEREYARQDGTAVILEIHPRVIRNAAGEAVGVRSFMLDITARKVARRALEKRAEELARSNAELEQFAYVASHDLQEPLRKIVAFGDRLKTKAGGSLGPECQDYLTRIQNAATRMQILIHDLLSLSRVASQARPFTPVDLAQVTRIVVSDLGSRMEQLGARVEVGPLPVIVADRGQMCQLLQNLIGNAIKFRKPGEPPVVRVSAELRPGEQGAVEDCRIVVEDNGIGFDEKYLDKIFQVFQRLHGRGEYEGTGIGLAICRKIVERHGGRLTARSQPGIGSTFEIILPYQSNTGEIYSE